MIKTIPTKMHHADKTCHSDIFLQDKRRLAGDTARQATSPEVKELRAEAAALKEPVADLTLENRSSATDRLIHWISR